MDTMTLAEVVAADVPAWHGIYGEVTSTTLHGIFLGDRFVIAKEWPSGRWWEMTRNEAARLLKAREAGR